jgi:hypothetical protein
MIADSTPSTTAPKSPFDKHGGTPGLLEAFVCPGHALCRVTSYLLDELTHCIAPVREHMRCGVVQLRSDWDPPFRFWLRRIVPVSRADIDETRAEPHDLPALTAGPKV